MGLLRAQLAAAGQHQHLRPTPPVQNPYGAPILPSGVPMAQLDHIQAMRMQADPTWSQRVVAAVQQYPRKKFRSHHLGKGN